MQPISYVRHQFPPEIILHAVEDEPEARQSHLKAAGVVVEDRTRWPRGGVSVQFRDPDGRLLETATP